MRFYFAHVGPSFARSSSRSEQSYVWQVYAPALATMCPTVRHGVLTSAALCMHLCELEADDGDDYLRLAEQHGNMFVEESSQKMTALLPQDTASVLICCRLLCVLGLGFHQIHRRRGAKLEDKAAWNWLWLIRGVLPLFQTILQAGHDIDDCLKTDMTPEIGAMGVIAPCSSIDNGMYQSTLFHFISNTKDERFAALSNALWTSQSKLTFDSLEAVRAALDDLLVVTEHVCSGNAHSLYRALCTWPAKLSQGFIDMLLGMDSLALTIYSHWLMLVVLAEDLWWIGDFGRAGICEVVEVCSDDSPSIQALLQWPLELATLT